MSKEVTRLTIQNNTLKLAPAQLAPLGQDDVQIEVIFTAISKNDLLLLQGKHKNDYFGVGAVGKVIEIGKNVGHCQVGDTVGVYHKNINTGEFKTGFTSHLQVHQHQVIYIPNTMEPEQAACLLGSGITAYRALENIEQGYNIAVVGTNDLAYLTVQFAKKAFDHKVTIFGYEGGEDLAKEWGADGFILLSNQSLQKERQKYQAVIVTDVVKVEHSANILFLAWRHSTIYYAIDMGFHPDVAVLDLVCSQISFKGVKRGDYGCAVKALKAAAYYGVKGKVQSFQAADFQEAFQKAKVSNAETILLKY